jgi:hypothetical protein
MAIRKIAGKRNIEEKSFSDGAGDGYFKVPRDLIWRPVGC